MASSPLSVLLTVADAASETANILGEWVTFLNGLDRDYELLLASERAGIATESLAAPYARVRALPAPEREGFGAALRQGLREARQPLLLYTTCDQQYKPDALKQLLRWIDQVDLVAGERAFPPGRKRSWDDVTHRWLARLVFGIRLKDVGCRFLLARRSIFGRIPIQSDGPFAHLEVLAKANFLGCLMTEVPVAYQPRPVVPGEYFWSDFHRVYSHPDFGPPTLPDAVAEPPGCQSGS